MKDSLKPWTIRSIDMAFPGEGRIIQFTALDAELNIVGAVGLKMMPQHAEFAQLFVREDLRKKGIGRLLLKECIEAAKAANLLSLSCYVSRGNPQAVPFYHRCGFTPVYRFGDGDYMYTMILNCPCAE